ncbi:hypothetical protein DM01DRAFT_1375729 [Hesseltinella vesiculosa]|uniref:Uncharacterized protein n=1 Tax=Hesseltinella vesiculosa TaxID=101127 RepID=A0A1X2GCZ4_9FUNG|nr:hypothetical protein DM01DRAFT_1375729 [Hesseltinella vesiculosa]
MRWGLEQSDKSASKKPAKSMDKQPPPPTVLSPTTRTEEDPCETEIGTVDLEHTVVNLSSYQRPQRQQPKICTGTGTFHFMKKLQRRKKAAKISESEALLAKNAMTFCTTHDDLLARYAKRQEASGAGALLRDMVCR